MRGAAGAGDDRPQAPTARRLGVGEHLVGHPMGARRPARRGRRRTARAPRRPSPSSASRSPSPSRRRSLASVRAFTRRARSQTLRTLPLGSDLEDDPFALDRVVVVGAGVLLGERVDVGSRFGTADLAATVPRTSPYWYGLSEFQTVTVTFGLSSIARYLARCTSVLMSRWSSVASTHIT